MSPRRRIDGKIQPAGPWNAIGAVLGWGAYKNSVADGQSQLYQEISSLELSCPSTSILLVGFSQGAQVTANTYQDNLTDSSGPGSSAWPCSATRGSTRTPPGVAAAFDPNQTGSLTHPSSRLRPAYPNNGRILSFCHDGDPVCQGFLH